MGLWHCGDVIMGAMAYQITSLTIVCPNVYTGADQRKHQSSASLAFVWGIHRWPVISSHKWPVTRKMFPFDDVIMSPAIIDTYLIYVWIRALNSTYSSTQKYHIRTRSSGFDHYGQTYCHTHGKCKNNQQKKCLNEIVVMPTSLNQAFANDTHTECQRKWMPAPEVKRGKGTWLQLISITDA